MYPDSIGCEAKLLPKKSSVKSVKIFNQNSVKFSALNFFYFCHKLEGLILGTGILGKQAAEPMAPLLILGRRQLQGRLSSCCGSGSTGIRIIVESWQDPDPHQI
jgi:hypothetical protein